MVIDDNPIDRLIVEKLLTRYNLAREVVCMEGALKALECLTEAEEGGKGIPSLILLDINMPEVDGFGFLQRFHELPEHIVDGCRVVMLSSSMDENDRSRSLSFGSVSHFINKPLTLDKMQEVVEYAGSASTR